MRSVYESVELEVITFEAADVISTSDNDKPVQESNEGPIAG